MRPDDNDEEAASGEEGQPEIEIPHTPFIPPPPEIRFERPSLGRAAPGRAFSRSEKSEESTGPVDTAGGDAEGGQSHLAAGLVIAVTLPSCIIVGALLGAWIDDKWPSAAPWGIVVMSLAGIAAGFLNVFRAVTMMDRPRKRRK